MKLQGKMPPDRPRLEWEDNVEINLPVVGCDVGDWIKQAPRCAIFNTDNVLYGSLRARYMLICRSGLSVNFLSKSMHY